MILLGDKKDQFMPKLALFFLFFLTIPCFARDMSDVAYDFATKFAPDEYKQFKKKSLERYKEWEQDNQTSSFKRFLDAKLLEVIPAIISKKNKNSEKNIKKICFWLALYVDFREPIPKYLEKATPDIIEEFDALATKDFTWEKLADFSRKLADRHKEEVNEEEEKVPD
jgi:hypothetical protein